MNAPVDVLALLDDSIRVGDLFGNEHKISPNDMPGQVAMREARARVAELADAGQNLRDWSAGIVAWVNGDWVINSEDDGHRLNGFAGTEHDARLELQSNRSWAIARFDSALAAFKGEA